MDSLPPELSLMIFELLPVRDALRVMLVCKSWNRLANCLRQRSLTVFDQKPDTISSSFFWVPDINDSLECRDENRLLIIPLSPMFRSIRKLKTRFYSMTLVEMSQFYNQFENLEELSCSHYYDVSQPIILNLQHLKKLSIKHYSKFDLRTPCLTYLKVFVFRYVLLYYPDRLRTLKTNFYMGDQIEFNQLTNLEQLIVPNDDWGFITNESLATMRKLKELHFATYVFEDRETLVPNFTYRRKGLRLFQFGFDIDQNLEVLEEEIEYFWKRDTTNFIVRNFEKTADTVHHRFEVDYNELARNGLADRRITDKFRKLTLVKASGPVDDENAVLEFLMQARPRIVRFEDALMSQRFLDQFALQCRFIRRIEFKNSNVDITGPAFEFVLKMKESLTSIKIHQQVSLDFLVKAFEQCLQLRDVCFLNRDRFYASFSSFDLDLYTVKIGADGSEQVFRCCFTPRTQTDLYHFLRSLRAELKPNNRRTHVDTLIFLVNNYKRNQRLLADLVGKLVRGELYYIYC